MSIINYDTGTEPVWSPNHNVCKVRFNSSLLVSNWCCGINREEVEEFFNDMDRDFDQRLSFEEFLGEESHIEKVFKSMDKNGDGRSIRNNLCQI